MIYIYFFRFSVRIRYFMWNFYIWFSIKGTIQLFICEKLFGKLPNDLRYGKFYNTPNFRENTLALTVRCFELINSFFFHLILLAKVAQVHKRATVSKTVVDSIPTRRNETSNTFISSPWQRGNAWR